MSESESNWWFGADRRWREGEPPEGWWQAPDGRWHPPSLMAKYLATPPFPSPMPPDETAELDTLEDDHRPRHRMSRVGDAAQAVPRSAKIAISAAAAVFVAGIAAVAWPAATSTTEGGQEAADVPQEQVDEPGPTTTTTASPAALESSTPSEEAVDESSETEPVVELGPSGDDEAESDAADHDQPSASPAPSTTRPGRVPSSSTTTTTTTTEVSGEDCETRTAPGQPDRPIGPDKCE